MAKQKVSLTINGKRQEVGGRAAAAARPLLRDVLGLTGTHVGCDTSQCGACTVILDGAAVKSCTVLRGAGRRRRRQTIEGLAQDGTAAPDAGGLLGGARPAVRLLHAGHDHDRPSTCCKSNPNPTEEEIRHGLEGNLCRCTGYQNIVKRRADAAADAKGSAR